MGASEGSACPSMLSGHVAQAGGPMNKLAAAIRKAATNLHAIIFDTLTEFFLPQDKPLVFYSVVGEYKIRVGAEK
jgi:hypothetical protein